jgi:hypothetical protein
MQASGVDDISTAKPSISITTQWISLWQLIQSVNFEHNSTLNNAVAYSEVVLNHQYIVGGCVAWNRFKLDLMLGLASRKVGKIFSLYVPALDTQALAQEAKNSLREFCEDPNFANRFVQNLVSSNLDPAVADAGRIGEMHCPSRSSNSSMGGSSWNTFSVCFPAGQWADMFCHNCLSTDDTASQSHSLMLAPCAPLNSSSFTPCSSATKFQQHALSQSSLLNKNGVIRMLWVTFEELDPPPLIVSISSTSRAQSIAVNVSLDKDGLVYCLGLERSAGPPSSIEQIMAAGNSRWSERMTSSLLIRQVSAATEYIVYCMSVSLDGVRTSLSAILAR